MMYLTIEDHEFDWVIVPSEELHEPFRHVLWQRLPGRGLGQLHPGFPSNPQPADYANADNADWVCLAVETHKSYLADHPTATPDEAELNSPASLRAAHGLSAAEAPLMWPTDHDLVPGGGTAGTIPSLAKVIVSDEFGPVDVPPCVLHSGAGNRATRSTR